jgi:uncharacterized protein YjbI with pentapeptide repeats
LADGRVITQNDLPSILLKHITWLESNFKEGEQANLSGAELGGVNLSGADLRWANLSGVGFLRANLSWANLMGASLALTNFERARLDETNLSGANFEPKPGTCPMCHSC